MYINSGYLNNSKLPFKDKSQPLIVGSCGTYRLKAHKKLPTWAPRGRVDWQLLFVASGKTHFYIGGKDQIVTAGHMVLFQSSTTSISAKTSPKSTGFTLPAAL